MRFFHTFKAASRGLLVNRSRSGLTILGIVIGITAIILVMSLGEGAQNLILNQIQSVGSKTITITPGKTSGDLSNILVTFSDSLTSQDLEVLKNKINVPYAKRIMPLVFGAETISYESEAYKPTIYGATSFFNEIYNAYPEEGRVFTDDEAAGYSDVVMLGSKVKEELFGGDSALNKRVKIKGRNFLVIGVFGEQGKSTFMSFDEAAIIPYTTAQQYIFGIKHFHRMIVEADFEENIDRTVRDIEITLRNSHNIADPKKDDFSVQTQAQAMDMTKSITTILTLLIAGVAAVSLLVGGVGIMNIMLVSISERTKEIGLRKAIGATDKDILMHFLLEAIILTSIGGIIGIILGLSLAFLVSFVLSNFLNLNWDFSFPIAAILLGLGVSAFVGLVFGIYPAKQAAKKSPIEALRYE